MGWLFGGVLLFVLTLVFLAGAGVRWNVILVFVTLFVAMTYMRPMKLRTLVGLGAGSVAVFVVVLHFLW